MGCCCCLCLRRFRGRGRLRRGGEVGEGREGADEGSHLSWSLPQVEDGKGGRVEGAVKEVWDRLAGVRALQAGGRVGKANSVPVVPQGRADART